MTNMRAIAIAQVISHHVVIASSLRVVSADANVFTVEDIAGSQYLVTVEAMYADTDGPTMTETWQKCRDRNVYTSAAEHAKKCGAHFDSELKVVKLMNNSDERDYEEEAANRALMEEHDDDGDDD